MEIDGVRKQLSRPGISVVNFVVKPLPGLISLAFAFPAVEKRI